ncbi:hypothetical protein C7212DRAFT_366544 [Tuber magnatum]|uniref:Uncharacterized protein n=1 Tax=Tuber magnatum TaxID=42249 RepID=A0A317SHJ9_9PEZI|nr:hypothetical protein C7212DRAFT_366544 [Tuber magnatum]
MASTRRGRPSKSVEEKKFAKKIADRKRYETRKQQLQEDLNWSDVTVAESGIKDKSKDIRTSYQDNTMQWRTISTRSPSELENVSALQATEFNTEETEMQSNSISESRQSHWPKILDIKQRLEMLDIGQKRGTSSVSAEQEELLQGKERNFPSIRNKEEPYSGKGKGNEVEKSQKLPRIPESWEKGFKKGDISFQAEGSLVCFDHFVSM